MCFVVIDMLKWSLAQLYKYNQKEFSFEDDLDYKEYFKDVNDILDMSLVHVKGKGVNLFGDRYKFDLHLECQMTLECARTLDEVIYPISIDVVEIFDRTDEDDPDIRLIEKNTIDLYDVIWEDVYLEKPMRVFKENTKEYKDDLNFSEDE